MIGAMYENGGNTTHRFLDGHPQMFVYPFESQLGHALVERHADQHVPAEVPLAGLRRSTRRPSEDYKAIIDEECKVRARTPHVSKFRHIPFDFNDDERCEIYAQLRREVRPLATGNNMAAFFRATFDAWKDYQPHAAARRSTSATARSSPSTPNDPQRPAAGARAARRAQSVVGLRRYQEAAGALAARELHARPGR